MKSYEEEEAERLYQLIKEEAEKNRKDPNFKEFTIEDLKAFLASPVFDNTRKMLEQDSKIAMGIKPHFPPRKG